MKTPPSASIRPRGGETGTVALPFTGCWWFIFRGEHDSRARITCLVETLSVAAVLVGELEAASYDDWSRGFWRCQRWIKKRSGLYTTHACTIRCGTCGWWYKYFILFNFFNLFVIIFFLNLHYFNNQLTIWLNNYLFQTDISLFNWFLFIVVNRSKHPLFISSCSLYKTTSSNDMGYWKQRISFLNYFSLLLYLFSV